MTRARPKASYKGAAAALSLAIGTLASLASASRAEAQTIPQPPTREEIQRGLGQDSDTQRGRAVTVDGAIERAPCPLADPQFADITLRLDRVEFANLSVVDPAELTQTYAEYVGRDVPVAVICEIRDRAATYLREKGYVAAVQVPPQQIDQGVVRLDVLMAKMAAVQVRGDAGPSEKLLARYIDKIASQPVFNVFEAERYLLLARDIPGLDVRLSLRPTDGQPGSVIGEFAVVRTTVFADLSVQNLGSKQVGRFGALGRIRFAGLTGLGDETMVTAFTTLDFREQQVLQGSHEFRLGSEGLTIGGDFTYSWSDPSLPGPDNFASDTLVAGVHATYPFIRTQASNVFGTLGFEYIDQQVDFAGIPLTEDTLSILYARLGASQISAASISGADGYSAIEPKWAISASLELRQGIDIFGASQGCGPGLVRCSAPGYIPPSRVEGDPTAFVMRADMRFDYRPDPKLALSLAPRVQYAAHPLLAYEEMSGGNFTVGRGFDPGAVIGDKGIGVRSEVAYGSLVPPEPTASAFQPFMFFDAQWVWNEDAAFNGLNPQDIYSIGGGLRATIRNMARIEALLAVPLNKTDFQTQTGGVRFLFTVTMQLAPWNL